jgi:hypothetical protein
LLTQEDDLAKLFLQSKPKEKENHKEMLDPEKNRLKHFNLR